MAISVLIVDDDGSFRRAAAELLADRGYHVVGEASSTDEAIALAVELEPDAVLLDVNLPDGDGVTLASALFARARPPRVLLTSTDPDAVSTWELESCGAIGFVPKARIARVDLDRYLKVGCAP
jgi:DNA-binding NarL/FixJ family response regulator